MFVSALTITLNSCSGDDDSSNSTGNTQGTVSMKLNGVQKNFSNIMMAEVEGSGIERTFIATDNGNPAEKITFITNSLQLTKPNSFVNLIYHVNEESYDFDYNSNTTINSDTQLQATFSGSYWIGEVKYEITEGKIDVTS